jgi:hypothetical protein
MIKRLKLETISSTLVVWGVVLESRELFVDKLGSRKPNGLDGMTPVLSVYGISLVAMGLVVEVMEYINNQFQLMTYNLLAMEVTAVIQWGVLLIVFSDTCLVNITILRRYYTELKERFLEK